jgi:hypothetical protein
LSARRGKRRIAVKNKHPWKTALWIIGAVALLGCGPKNGTLRPQSPWDEGLAEYFDDSVDFTLNPQSLSGQWLYKYQDQLSVRMLESELVLGVNVISITKKSDPSGRSCKDLYSEVKAKVKGEYGQKSVALRVCDDQAGFDSFKEEDTRLFEKIFIVFIKLYSMEDGNVGMHWHLSPLSKGLKDGMDKILKESKDKKKKQETQKYVIENK